MGRSRKRSRKRSKTRSTVVENIFLWTCACGAFLLSVTSTSTSLSSDVWDGLSDKNWIIALEAYLKQPNGSKTNKNNNPSTYNVLWPDSLIHDKTLPWSSTVYRPWLDSNLPRDRQPPAMLLLTSYGWNQPNQETAIQLTRHKRETELFTAIVNHPWFHPSLWDDILYHDSRNSSALLRSDIRYYIFLDMHQYKDDNYPKYNGRTSNLDRQGTNECLLFYDYPNLPIFKTLLFQQRFDATAILFNGLGKGIPPHLNRTCSPLAGLPMSIVTISSMIRFADPVRDQGLVPAAPNPIQLTPRQVQEIQTCEAETKRSFYMVFSGNYRSGTNWEFNRRFGGTRKKFAILHNNKRVLCVRHFAPEYNRSVLANMTYSKIMTESIFSLAPRGDNKFSYRFTEVLSAGGIPIVLADDWLWPFRPEAVDWTKCAVILPEKTSAKDVMAHLGSISVQQRCRMRQTCHDIYKTLIETPQGNLRGILEGLEKVATTGKALPFQGIHCDAFEDPTECNPW